MATASMRCLKKKEEKPKALNGKHAVIDWNNTAKDNNFLGVVECKISLCWYAEQALQDDPL